VNKRLFITVFLIVFFVLLPQIPAHAFVFSLIATAIGGVLTAVGVSAGVATVIGTAVSLAVAVGAKILLGMLTTKKQKGYDTASPTYSFGVLKTQANNTLPIPIVYGTLKLAGNCIWQTDPGVSTIQRIVCFAEGPIQGFSDIRFNDNPVGELAGCSYTAYVGTDSQLIDSRVPGSTQQAKADLVGGLKNIAYLALTAKASDKLDGDFTVTSIVQGSKIKVYTNLTTYSVKYSNNPAWCIYDFLTRYNGCELDPQFIDLQSFIDAAAYCDEQIWNPTTRAYQKRFTLNLILDERRARLDWLDEMILACRAYFVYQGGKLHIQIEKAEDVKQHFDKDSILKGSQKWWTQPRENRYDVVKVQFVDPENEYARVYAQAEADEFENEQPITQELEIYGVTNFNQASRLAWYYLNQSKTCRNFISFRTHKIGLNRTPGEVISITDDVFNYERKPMRILKTQEFQEGYIEITCKEYNPDLYADQLGSADPVINHTTLYDIFQPGDVTHFTATQYYTFVQFYWQPVAGSNITYEIREGSSWNSSKVVATGISGTSYMQMLEGTGIKHYWIKARGKYSSYSNNAASASLSVVDITNMNVIMAHNVFNPLGALTSTKIYNSKLKLKSA
jgi:hypothetical protein